MDNERSSIIDRAKYLTNIQLEVMNSVGNSRKLEEIATRLGMSTGGVTAAIRSSRSILMGEKVSDRKLCSLLKQASPERDRLLGDMQRQLSDLNKYNLIIFGSRNRQHWVKDQNDSKNEDATDNKNDESNYTVSDGFASRKQAQHIKRINIVEVAQQNVELERQEETKRLDEVKLLESDRKLAIISRTFDPITIADVYLVKQALKLAYRVILLVENDIIHKSYNFDADIRKSWIKTTFLGNERVSFGDTHKIVEEYMSNSSTYLEVKGLYRDSKPQDLIDEYRISRLINDNYQVVYIPIPSEYECVTSQKVIEIHGRSGNIKGMVPDQVSESINNLLKSRGK